MLQYHGAESHTLANDVVQLAITVEGGHMAPVSFKLADGRQVSPYALAPWLPEEAPDQPPLLRQLRGDFFCFPFGPQTDGPPHGETANAPWTLLEQTDNALKLAIDPTDTGGHIEKILSLRQGQTAIYIEHLISGVDGQFNYGNHPILDLSSLAVKKARLSTSPFIWGSVYPGLFSDPKDGARGALEPAASFESLEAVPLAGGGMADLSRYPFCDGTDDLVMMVNDPDHGPFAWTAAVLDGYVWFSLKKPADFPATLFWLSNGGRSAAPWNGRHRLRLGLEEVCSHFSDGVDIARENRLADRGIPTVRTFQPDESTRLPVIQAVAAIPDGFGKVTAISPGEQSVTLHGESSAEVSIPLDLKFLT